MQFPSPFLIACGWQSGDNTAGTFLWKKRQSRVEIWRFLQVSLKRHFHNTRNQPFVVLLVTMSSFASVLVSLWRFLLLHRFMDNLQTEMLEIEFLSYSRGLPTISEEDFARILLRYTNVDDVSGYLENVRHSIPDEKVILYFFFFAGSLCGHKVPLTAVIPSPNVHKVDKITVIWQNNSNSILIYFAFVWSTNRSWEHNELVWPNLYPVSLLVKFSDRNFLELF